MAVVLGPRGRYKYDSDDGNTYSVTTLVSLAAAAGLSAADGTEKGPLPRRWKPRVVHLQFFESTAKKFYRKNIITSPASALFTSDSETTVTIDGAAFKCTGRRGEVRTVET